jgi:hypothetical protein
MVRERGYRGGPDYFRHLVARHRSRRPAETYLRLRSLPGEQALTNSRSKPMNNLDTLQARAKALQLNGLLAHSTQVATGRHRRLGE